MSSAHDRWICPPGEYTCRFCSSKDGAIFLAPTAGLAEGFHLDCLIKSWEHGEARIPALAQALAANIRLGEQITQLQAEARRRANAGVDRFADNLRRVAAAPMPLPKPAPVPPRMGPDGPIVPKKEEPKADRFALIELE